MNAKLRQTLESLLDKDLSLIPKTNENDVQVTTGPGNGEFTVTLKIRAWPLICSTCNLEGVRAGVGRYRLHRPHKEVGLVINHLCNCG